jgi:hypothetical protein
MSVEARVYFDMLLEMCREVEKAPESEARHEPETEGQETDGDEMRSASVEAEGRLQEELLILTLTELLALVIMASASTLLWEGKVLLYLGDNKVVIAWVSSRQAAHPVARYLLQLLVALECIHHFGDTRNTGGLITTSLQTPLLIMTQMQ